MAYRGIDIDVMFYVYILKCSDGKFYTGSARGSLERRVNEHNAGIYESWTAKRLPVMLVYHEEFDNPISMIENERRIKNWSHAKKQSLIEGDFDNLKKLSKKNFKK